MDSETRAYLDQLVGELRAEMGGLRAGMGDLRGEVGGLRGELDGLRGEVGGLRGEVGGLRSEVADLRGEVGNLGGLRGEVATLRVEMRESADETRRHFDVTAEFMRHDLRTVAAVVGSHIEVFDRFRHEIRSELDARFRAQDAALRVAFAEIRRDIVAGRARG